MKKYEPKSEIEIVKLVFPIKPVSQNVAGLVIHSFRQAESELLPLLNRALDEVEFQKEKGGAIFKLLNEAEKQVESKISELNASEERVRELEKLAYIGEYQFEDSTWKYRLNELVPKYRKMEEQVRSHEAMIAELREIANDPTNSFSTLRKIQSIITKYENKP